MMRRLLVLALLAATCAASSVAMAEVYKWIDAKGGVHYSDRPAEGAVILAIVSRRTDREAVAERTDAQRAQRQEMAAQNQKIRASQAATSAVKADVSAARAEQCKKAQEQYKITVESIRLYRVGKDGEREYLNEAELTEARLNAKRAVDAVCQPAN